jgi:hypothetical protein
MFDFHEVRLIDGISRLLLPVRSTFEQEETEATKGANRVRSTGSTRLIVGC